MAASLAGSIAPLRWSAAFSRLPTYLNSGPIHPSELPTRPQRRVFSRCISDHDGPCIGSTRDNLELYSDDDGLWFRLNNFPKNELGRECRDCVATNEPMSMSVGCNYRYALRSKRVLDGLTVMVVEQSHLNECTWLVRGRPGADQHAFASYENVDGSRGLADDVRSGKLQYDFAGRGMARALRNLSKRF
jgi:hypothetical protein